MDTDRVGRKSSLTAAAAVVAALVALSPQARAQATLPAHSGEQISRNVFGIGLSAGPVSGIGLSFRHHLPARFSYQLAGGIIKVDDKLSYAVGAEAQFDFSRKESERFFLVLATGYYHSGKPEENELSGPVRVGLGVGAEVPWGDSSTPVGKCSSATSPTGMSCPSRRLASTTTFIDSRVGLLYLFQSDRFLSRSRNSASVCRTPDLLFPRRICRCLRDPYGGSTQSGDERHLPDWQLLRACGALPTAAGTAPGRSPSSGLRWGHHGLGRICHHALESGR